MGRYCSIYLWCISLSLWGQFNPGEYNGTTANEVRRTIQMLITTSSRGVTATVFAPAQEPEATLTIQSENLANIQVTTATATTTWSQFKKNSTLTLPLTVTYVPNPDVTGGYQGFIYIGTSSMNLSYLSAFYFNYQGFPLSAVSPSSLLYFTVTTQGQALANWLEGGTGIALAPNWTSSTVAQVGNSFGSTKGTPVTFNIALPYANVVSLPFGQYWFAAYAIMQPYTTPAVSTALIQTILTNAQEQISIRNSWITSINNLTNMSSLGKKITSANITLLQNQIKAIIAETNAYLATLAKTPGASSTILQSITSAQATLTALTP